MEKILKEKDKLEMQAMVLRMQEKDKLEKEEKTQGKNEKLEDESLIPELRKKARDKYV